MEGYNAFYSPLFEKSRTSGEQATEKSLVILYLNRTQSGI